MVGRITPEDKNWPEQLSDLERPPIQLFYEGEWTDDLFCNSAAVVGSRRMTDYGRRVIEEKLVPQLAAYGQTIISGLMYGTDQAVHRATMECGGRTVGILGWGINYKKIGDEDMKIQKKIIESGGVIISEWENQPGTLWTFPQRDRIMAALANEIYIVEAAEKSGSMITADWGHTLSRKVWAVPGPITSRVSAGTNKLIAEGKAQMWIPGVGQRIGEQDTENSSKEAVIYTAIQNEALGIDELARKLNRPVEVLGAELSLLILSGKIAERNGKYYLTD